MSTISVNNLTFAYDYSSDIIFSDLSLNIDTNWKLGFIGRNGKGKTTFLNLLLGKYEYKGKITSDVHFEYFPYEIENIELNSYEISKKFIYEYEEWKLEREISLLDKEINRLEASARQAATWSDKVEASKHHMTWDGPIDKGFIGHKAAKMMKRSTLASKRKEKAIADKSKLLKNIEVVEDLKLTLLPNRKGRMIDIKNLSIKYDGNVIHLARHYPSKWQSKKIY